MQGRLGVVYPYILLIFVVLFYAGNILIGKALNDLLPFTIAFLRLFVALIFLFPIGIRSAREHRATFWNHRRPLLIMTLTGVAFFNTFIYGALQYTSATNVSVLETVIPVLTVILSAFLLKERLLPLQWIGVIISFTGALWVVIDGRFGNLVSLNWNIGDIIMIGAILSWSVYSIVVKQSIHLFPPLGALFMMTSIATLVLFPFVVIEWWVYGVPYLWKVDYILGFLYLGIFPSLIALIFYNNAVEQLGASKASVFLNFLPVFTMGGAYLWLGEKITLMQVTGALLVISGVVLTTQIGKKRKNHRGVKSKVNEA
ncbi:EamA/RhaT family transporter [Halobacillus litoralis]|uniref:EamA/RhaT family transporter n=1 Tax=Halobacillus litoralis TaxID=45668 RepID=A0A410MIU0_9BACI|nr:EamA/RhaT family transporter [Halobacillus litoralis]